MTAKPVGVSQVFPRSPIETLFNDRYFVSGSGIAKWNKDSALITEIVAEFLHHFAQEFFLLILSKKLYLKNLSNYIELIFRISVFLEA